MPGTVFVIGATGFVGAGIASHLASTGHQVTGLARTDAAAAQLRGRGFEALPGDLDADLATVLKAARQAEAVIYAAQIAFDREPAVIRALIEELAGSGKTLIFLSGTGVLMQRTAGAWSSDSFAEEDPFVPEPLAMARVEAEGIVRAADGLRAMVIRPPVIWGPDDNGPIAAVYRSIGTTGAACYVGTGLTAYSNVHRDDLARLFSSALEHGRPGALYHAVAGEVPYRWIAEAVARDMGVPSRSLTIDEAADVFGPFGALLHSSCSRSRDKLTRAELSWAPIHLDLLSQVGEPRLRALATPKQSEGASA